MLTTLLAAALIAHAATDPLALPSTLRARIGDPEVIHAAAKAAIAANPAGVVRVQSTALGADPTPAFTRAMNDARVPDCLHPDATKLVPPKLGPIGIGGIYALPFWLGAIAQGKCN